MELSILLKGKMLLVHGSIKPCDLSVTNLDDKDEEFIDLFSFFLWKFSYSSLKCKDIKLAIHRLICQRTFVEQW